MPNEIIQQEQQTAITAPAANSPSDFISSFRESYKLAQIISQTAIIPETYQNKPADCAIAIDMANRMNVSPMMVMQNLYVVKGKPSWSGQACKALVEGCGKFLNVRHQYFGEKGKDTRGCRITAAWADTGEIIEGPDVTIQMAKSEGWAGKNPKWSNMPELMLAYRASAFFARVYCPEILMGVHVEGEAEDVAKPERQVNDIL